MSCHNNTDRPHAVPRDAATVPTMTRAATTERVISTMIAKIRIIDAMTAIIKSMETPSCISAYIEAVPAIETLALDSGVPLTASATTPLRSRTCSMPSTEAGSPWWVMMNRTALPSGETNILSPRLKSGLVNTSGGR
ncbi:Uncharacterised protein [Mycobacteroides abscessus]|nr:Uncharacterised protein [Mycobacteroides abscessus]